MAANLSPWNYAVIWLLVASGLYAAFVIDAMNLATLVWLEGAAVVLGLIALVLRNTSQPIFSIRQILNQSERPRHL